MDENLTQVFGVYYVDPRIAPADWAHSDGMTIGYFSTEEKARQAIQSVQDLPGFCEDHGGFSITAYELGDVAYPEGFEPADDLKIISTWLEE